MSDILKTIKRKSKKNGVYTNIHNNNIIPAMISKPEQGKKTIEMSQLLDHDLNEREHILNFYVTPNRRNQANQAENTFTKFMSFFKEKTQLYKHDDKIDVLHQNKCNTRDPDGFVRRAERESRRLIIALSNKSRLSIVFEIIVKWIKSNNTNMCKIYIDEAGDPTSLNSVLNHIWKNLEAEISDLQKVKLIFIDAHFRAIIENKSFIKYFPLETIYKLENKHDLKKYMYFSSLPYKICDWDKISCIIESYKRKEIIFNNNDYVLLPLYYIKDDQYDEASEFVDSVNDCVVLVINGDGYHVFRKDSYRLTLPKKPCGKKRRCMKDTCPKCFPNMEKELNVVKYIKRKYASNKIFCLGGNHCIDRAMTYQDPTLQFSKALITKNILIMSPFSQNNDYKSSSNVKKESVSQRVKRICHSFGNEVKATFYGPREIYDGICKLEQDSTCIANQSGYITQNINDQLKDGLNPSLETKEQIQKYELERNPYDYYLMHFGNLTQDVEYIHKILSEFRIHIGGTRINRTTITKRMIGKEPDDHLSDNSLKDYKETISVLRTGLDIETANSRVRVTKDKDGNNVWLIHYLYKRNTIVWDGFTYTVIPILKDGNCLFNSFVSYNLPGITSIKKMRREVSMELRTNKDKYDKANIDEDDWDDDCDKIKIANNWNDDIFDYCMMAISEKYDINIVIFVFITLKCGGYEKLYKNPKIIPEQKNKSNIIYLRKLDNHYDLLSI